MQPLRTEAPALTGIGTEVTSSGTRGQAVGTAASTGLTILPPAGSEEISAFASAAFGAEGMQMLAINTLAQQEVMQGGVAQVRAATLYTATDEAAGTSLL